MRLAASVRKLVDDPRHWQIAALGAFVVYSFFFLDFGAKPVPTGVALGASILAQLLGARIFGLPFEWRSATITGLSLSLLLRTGTPAIMALAAAFAILSKFLFRTRGKHLFNPAAFGIVAVLLGTREAWVSPGQWGGSAWFAAFILLLAGAVLTRAPRMDTALAFLAAHLALLVARAAWLGDPAAIPLHQMMTGSLLIFAFFMITDPRTTPDSRIGRVVFAVSVAAVAHALSFFGQVRPALYFSLLLIAPLVLLLDWLLPRSRFAWNSNPPPTTEPA